MVLSRCVAILCGRITSTCGASVRRGLSGLLIEEGAYCHMQGLLGGRRQLIGSPSVFTGWSDVLRRNLMGTLDLAERPRV